MEYKMTNQHEQDVITVLEHVKKYPYGYMGALTHLKKNHVIEAKIFVILLAISMGYLASRFIIDFLNL